ncbi:bifunctional hydroxymethylpyrimidine kinase/phosphomethylpyrimidine kinase [Paenibacillus sp. MMS20-IR301]|uniref:bifunctional hydroxymethylpyrimidine kinase/phosphomethylpyrimidine kinase n=1 Tax=Paenibacillus sp. MMS20-IR301 TaxID=2895946 RepID=UPI0028EEA87D|nr:bifunctional hydroxymethylpyrimidine kinase/phosphomethylpyrimidine kinase [Paenibacillus sp. MMS20-IR301]WNS45659.1 bifunctional hydroxymethylpyrimidine kinase/phosphomethylpyrimidine kinase [Paenibacillus sp. MMS20-IR301]
MTNTRTALTIAGSDSGGGAGIQADLKTFQELGVYGMSALTAVTAQNTLGVQAVYPLSPEAVGTQLDSVGSDLPPDAVKTGMLFSSEIIITAARKVQEYGWQDRLVIDPVMVAKGGSPLLLQEAVQALIASLLPLAQVLTPNLPEAEILTGMKIGKMNDREQAARLLYQMGPQYIVLKGGHAPEGSEVVDLLYDGREFQYMTSPRIETRHTHGTGCTYSAALTAGLALGYNMQQAVHTAKAFIQAAIEDSLNLGAGHGPTNHFAYGKRRSLRGDQP